MVHVVSSGCHSGKMAKKVIHIVVVVVLVIIDCREAIRVFDSYRSIERVSVTFFLFLFLFLLQQTRVPKRVDSDIRLFHSMMMEIHLHPTHCLGGVKCCRKIILVLFRWSGGVASSNRHTRDATVTRVGKIQYFGVEFAFVRNRSLAPYNDHPPMNGSSVFSSLTHTHSRQASTCYNT